MTSILATLHMGTAPLVVCVCRSHCPANRWNARLSQHFSIFDIDDAEYRRHGSVLDHRVSFCCIHIFNIIAINMTSTLFRYLSPKSVTTMSRLDNTIISVHEDDPESPTIPAVDDMIADVQSLNSNQRTKNQFRPRIGKGGATSYQLRQYAEVTLGGGSLRKVVKLPEGEDENEWLAVNSELPVA